MKATLFYDHQVTLEHRNGTAENPDQGMWWDVLDLDPGVNTTSVTLTFLSTYGGAGFALREIEVYGDPCMYGL